MRHVKRLGRFRARKRSGPPKHHREAQKVGKITGSCDYRHWKGRVTWDYREADDGTSTTRR